MRTEAQKRARRRYDRKCKKLQVTVYPSEPDIEDRLDEVRDGEGISPYVKRLIREDIARGN